MTPQHHPDDLSVHTARAVLLGPTLGEQHERADDVYDQTADTATPPPAPPVQPPPPAPATPTHEPEPEPEPGKPTAQEAAEQRKATEALRAADQLRAKADNLARWARFWMGVVITISVVITTFGAGNAHAVFLRHDTTDPWAWLPYPALEAALIVEIQIGGLLAEHKQRVVFWGTALRLVTAIAAVTLCVYGPAEEGDAGGAVLHAIGPFVQFWLAEFLAAARTKFRLAAEGLLDRAAGRERAAQDPGAGTGADRSSRSRKRSQRSAGTGRKDRSGTGAETSSGDRSSDSGTGPELVLSGPEKAAYDAIQRKGLTPSKRTVIAEVRAAHGQIGTTRALVLARAWGPGPGGPNLHVVNEKEAK